MEGGRGGGGDFFALSSQQVQGAASRYDYLQQPIANVVAMQAGDLRLWSTGCHHPHRPGQELARPLVEPLFKQPDHESQPGLWQQLGLCAWKQF